MKLVVIFALFALAIGKKKENSGKSMQKEGKIKIKESKGMPLPYIEENIEEEPHGEGKVKAKAPEKEKTLNFTPDVGSHTLLVKEYGKFSELKHGVSGKVSSSSKDGKEVKVLDITDFNYSGEGT